MHTDKTIALWLVAAGIAFGQGARPAEISGATAKEIPPFQIFDNLYYVGIDYVSSYVIKTSAGLILIDSLYDKFTGHTVPALAALGLNAKDIKYVILTHGHIDHYGGAKAIQTLSDARVAMTEADWALMERSNRAGAGAIPGRDIVIKDGDSIKLGDTTLKMYVTPGHTPGVASMEFTAYDGGVPHKAFLFGGHNVTSNQVEAFEMFIASVKRLQATLTGIDVSLTSHPWAALILERGEELKNRKPGDPHPFVAPEEFKAFLDERLADAEKRLGEARAATGK